jgi:hypothetical protein
MTTFIPDNTFTDAIYSAIARMLRDMPAPPPDAAPMTRKRGRYLPGVCKGPVGLYARFVRHVDGYKRYIHVATGTMGDYSEAEEQRLHALWCQATAAWDKEHGR